MANFTPYSEICKKSRKCAKCSEHIKKGEELMMFFKGNSKKPLASHVKCYEIAVPKPSPIVDQIKISEDSPLFDLVSQGNIKLIKKGNTQMIEGEVAFLKENAELFKAEKFKFNLYSKMWSRVIMTEVFDPNVTYRRLVNEGSIWIIEEDRAMIIAGDSDVLTLYSGLFEAEGYEWNDHTKRWTLELPKIPSKDEMTVESLIAVGELTVMIEDDCEVLFGKTKKHKELIKSEGWTWNWSTRRWGRFTL